MGSIPSKSGPDMEVWFPKKRPFTSAKRVKRAMYLTQGKKVTRELDKSGIFKALFERFRAISSDFEQFQGTPGRLILRIEPPYLIWSRLRRKSGPYMV